MSVYKLRGNVDWRKGLIDLINHTNLDNITMIEVGSYAGEGADIFCSIGKVKSLWCIDPWIGGYDNKDRTSSICNFTDVETAFDEIAQKHSDIIHKFKGVLSEFIEQHPEVKPDLIYIDGCHTYEAVTEDIKNSLTLKPIFLAGHDYVNIDDGFCDCSRVYHAVYDSLGEPDATFCDTSWIVDLRKRT